MPFFRWSESMSVGVPMLDADHRVLIRLINGLHDSLEAGEESAVLGWVFDNLTAYIEFHFAREEEVMRACGYPGAEAHHAEHVGFADHIHELRKRYAQGAEKVVPRELLDYLKDWLYHHILIQDMSYKPYVRADTRAEAVAQAFGPVLPDDALAAQQGPR